MISFQINPLVRRVVWVKVRRGERARLQFLVGEVSGERCSTRVVRGKKGLNE